MGKPTGFMEYERETAKAESPLERIHHFNEFHTPLSKEKRLSSEQPGAGVERSAVQRMLRTGLRQTDEDTLFSRVYLQSLPGTV